MKTIFTAEDFAEYAEHPFDVDWEDNSLEEGLEDIPLIERVNFINKKVNGLPGIINIKDLIAELNRISREVGSTFKVRTSKFGTNLSYQDIKDEWLSFKKLGWFIDRSLDPSLSGFNEVYICSKICSNESIDEAVDMSEGYSGQTSSKKALFELLKNNIDLVNDIDNYCNQASTKADNFSPLVILHHITGAHKDTKYSRILLPASIHNMLHGNVFHKPIYAESDYKTRTNLVIDYINKCIDFYQHCGARIYSYDFLTDHQNIKVEDAYLDANDPIGLQRIKELYTKAFCDKEFCNEVLFNGAAQSDIDAYVDEIKRAFNLITEDTVKKKNGKWVNRGDDGEEHGTFTTKKQADAQRKAMYVNGYRG